MISTIKLEKYFAILEKLCETPKLALSTVLEVKLTQLALPIM